MMQIVRLAVMMDVLAGSLNAGAHLFQRTIKIFVR